MAMVVEEEKARGNGGTPRSNGNSPNKQQQQNPSSNLGAKDRIVSVASNFASQPLHNSDPNVWGVLTAISNNARKRHQGINILLTADEHRIGRLVEDVRFQIDSNSVSANHCRIYRTKITNENMEDTTSIFLKDTSTNGTYLNWEKLKKKGAAVKVCHGDIIAFAAPPQHENAFAFVYREVHFSNPVPENAVAKRKAEDFVSENKRLKGLGIGAPEGPISLDDFRSLQRSNSELRKQLENQVVTIDTLRSDNRAAIERHESELKSAKESVTKCYLDQVKDLQQMVELKQKELGDVNRAFAEQKHTLEDLNERLSSSMQSCSESNELISSQKVSIAELKEQLDEERTQRKKEREKAAVDLKAAVRRAQSEAQEEIKRVSDAALRRESELQEAINKLKESEREMCLLVETLRSKLEDTRQKLVVSDNKVRQLETQVDLEKLAAENGMKKVEELEQETRRLRKELESEKQAAREEAWAKVSVLELEIDATMRDLDFERRRLKGARERLMLRETQLRSFYSTTEEIQSLFAKQQEQLKAMQRTLEDDENYDNTSADMDGVVGGTSGREKGGAVHHSNNAAKAGSTTSAQKLTREQVETSSNEASVTEKHDCDIRSEGCQNTQEACQNTQEAEFTSADNDHGVRGCIGSDVDGVGTTVMMEGDAIGTERVLETESPSNIGERNFDLNKESPLEGDTMKIDDDMETEKHDHQTPCREHSQHSQSNIHVDTEKTIEGTEAGCLLIRTEDLITSEVPGSWACNTAPSAHGENESSRSRDNNESSGALLDSNIVVAESPSTPSDAAAAARKNERRALSEMIGIVAPDLKEQFEGAAYDCGRKGEDHGGSSDSDTESCSDTGDGDRANAKCESISDEETQGVDHVEEDQKQDDSMDEDDEATQED
ncbi:myosin heavy chain, striated muscle-like isoform X1 [Trifolium pratense]|uniref:myosin heavy chain, striated muscle-like isoform X1 n=1 Tax=Trifolium pratense TaxID=57577 RepID=UPI001E693E83|nr:myosin heavy chain, striated muscle-like isoform X1 [Trifolium pratense]